MSSPDPSVPAPNAVRTEEPSIFLWGAMLVGLAAVAGSLYLSLGMGLKACPLCLYQRAFVMSAVGVLAVGFFARDVRAGAIGLFALPLAAAALGMAGIHSYLEYTGFLECPRGVSGLFAKEDGFAGLSAPQESLIAEGLLVLLLVIDLLRQGRLAGILGGALLGGLFAFGAFRTAPPSPAPARAYELPINQDGCRRPFTANPAP